MSTGTIKSDLERVMKSHSFFSVPNERTFLYRNLCSFAKAQTGKKILDVGAGHQQYRHLFENGNTYEACDLKDGFHQERKPDFYASIYEIPKENSYYDIVLLLQVLEHLEFPLKGLQETHRILKDGGLLYISVPQAAGDHFEPHHYFNYTQYGLQSVLRQSGFEILEHRRLAGIFAYVGNRIMKLGQIVRGQYREKGNILQKGLSIIFKMLCHGAGYLVSLFNFLDHKKHYCIGHIVIARKITHG